MAGGARSTAILQVLLDELERCAREEASGADGLTADARDHDRWGLAGEADALRDRARRHRVRALLYGGKAAAWRAHEADPGRAGP